MKKTAIIFILSLLFALPAIAQWQKQNIGTTASLRGLSVVSDQVIWASGTGGTFLRTTDGGKTWKKGTVPDAIKLDFRDVEAFDANTAYLLSIGNGENSRIYKTTDGGDTWQLQYKNTDEKAFFDAFAFWDRNSGIAMSDPVNGRYYLLSTKDGGKTWKALDTSKMPAAIDGEAAFAASGTCLIVNGKTDVYLVSGGKAARVFHSKNRGKTWTVVESPLVKGGDGTGIFSIAMRDAKNGVIVGGNYVKPNEETANLAFTTDGGKTWVENKGMFGYRSGVSYIDKQTIIAVGSSGSTLSNDGGKTWKIIDTLSYNAVQAKGAAAIWAVGDKGMVAKYTR